MKYGKTDSAPIIFKQISLARKFSRVADERNYSSSIWVGLRFMSRPKKEESTRTRSLGHKETPS